MKDLVSDERKEKLFSILYAIRDLDEFSSDAAKMRCHDTAPAYVTRVINRLAQDGLLSRIEVDNKERFRWVRDAKLSPESWIERQIFGEQIKQSPEGDRPREQLLRDGPSKLTNAQLIAILIRVGIMGESAVQAGRVIGNRFSAEKIASLPEMSLAELRKISKTIRKDSYAQIMAGIELGRRIAKLRDEPPSEIDRIRGSDDAIRYCSRVFGRLASDAKQEEFHIVTLDTQHGPIGTHLISIGTLDASLVHPREVFRAAIRDAASAILLVHNHPSGDSTPSREDKAVTDRLTQVGEMVGIRVLDHIIVAKERCRSVLAER
jgi:DNA repair protein RadC